MKHSMDGGTMRKLWLSAVVLVVAIAVLWAQRQRVSPHETTDGVVGGKKVTITYGRPYLKDRKIGGAVAPYGQVWRTGANEATTLVTEGDLMIGDLKVPAGTYTLYTLPTEKSWKLIVNKQTGQWGTEYQQGMDLGRTDMKLGTGSHSEQLTLSIGGDQLKLAWGTVVATVPVKAAK
jgi:hypothetical protein